MTLQGQIVSTYTIGCILGSIIIIPTGDKIGRCKSVMLGCLFVSVGGLLQASSFTLAHMIVGRVISGIGIGINTTTIPMWQSETCKASLRGKLVAIQLTTLVFGKISCIFTEGELSSHSGARHLMHVLTRLAIGYRLRFDELDVSRKSLR